MRTIAIDEDVYQHLVRNTEEIGESAGSTAPSGEKKQLAPAGTHEFSQVMGDPRFLRQNAAVDKFLYFLSVAYSQKRGEFEKILAIQGRDRKYFAKSKEEIENSGQSTQPRNIPGSPYWVMTNSPTTQKRQMLRDALSLLGYSETAISAAAGTIT
jgi:negative modulator of initiation of replication